jgi:hypothetical protein
MSVTPDSAKERIWLIQSSSVPARDQAVDMRLAERAMAENPSALV